MNNTMTNSATQAPNNMPKKMLTPKQENGTLPPGIANMPSTSTSFAPSSSSSVSFHNNNGTTTHNPSNNTNNELRILRNSLKYMQILPTEEDIRVNSAVKAPRSTVVTNVWCLVYYYELNERVGEVFKAEWHRNEQHQREKNPQLVIDGGVCSSSENTRYCLGVIGNINRNPVVTSVRRSIGKGLRLFQRDDNIYLECLSDSALFVQCPLFARRSGDELPTVYKLKSNNGAAGGTPSTCSESEPICLFDAKLFDELLREARPRGYNALYMLQVYCLCRISFVKGWGQQYRRQTITSCPMWIEVQFPRPLQMLDRVLMECAHEIGMEEVHSFS